MARRKIHAPALIDDRCLQRLRELDEALHPGRRAREPVRHDDGMLGGDEEPRELGDGPGVALRRRRHRHLRDRQLRVAREGPLLQLGVEHQHDGRHRWGERDFVRADGRLREVRERHGRVVPFRVIAHHRRGVLHAVRPLGAGAPHRGVELVAEHHVHRYAIAPRVVDRHRRVLQTHGTVREHAERPAFDLGVAVRHGDRRLLVATRDQLGAPVAAVIDHRFVDPAKARAGIGADVVESQRLQHVDHEVRACPIRRQDLDIRRVGGFSRRRHDGRRRHRCALHSRLWGSFCGGRGECRARGSRTLQEPATTDGWQFRFHVTSARSAEAFALLFARLKPSGSGAFAFPLHVARLKSFVKKKPSHSISFG